MNILFLTPRLPYPPNRGDRVRTFNLPQNLYAIYQLVQFLQKEEFDILHTYEFFSGTLGRLAGWHTCDHPHASQERYLERGGAIY